MIRTYTRAFPEETRESVVPEGKTWASDCVRKRSRENRERRTWKEGIEALSSSSYLSLLSFLWSCLHATMNRAKERKEATYPSLFLSINPGAVALA